MWGKRKKGVTTVTVVVKKGKSWVHDCHEICYHLWICHLASHDWLLYVSYLLVYSVHGEDAPLGWVMARDSDHSNCKVCETRSDDDNEVRTCAH